MTRRLVFLIPWGAALLTGRSPRVAAAGEPTVLAS
jgi:hypothetical protein